MTAAISAKGSSDDEGVARGKGFRGKGYGRRLAEAVPDLVCIVSGGKVAFVNSAGVNLLGARSAQELVGKRFAEFLASEYRMLAEDDFRHWLDEGDSIPIRMRRLDGGIVDVEVVLRPLDNGPECDLVIVSRDVTKLKRAATELLERERRLSAVTENVADGLITIDEEGRIESFNRSAEQIFGYTAAEVTGQAIDHLMGEPWRSAHGGYLANHLNTGEVNMLGRPPREVIGQHKDGSAILLELAISKIQVGGRDLFIGVMREISERKRAEQALRESEQRFRDYAEAASDWFWEMDADQCFTYLSDRFYELTGFSPEDIVGKSRSDMVSEPGDDNWHTRLEEIENCQPFQDLRYLVALPSGDVMHISTNGRPLFDESGTFLGYRGTGSDVTVEVAYQNEVRQAQAQLRESEKLNALGQLAGGVAHDFNNILMIIGGYTRIALKDPEISERSRGALGDVLRAADKAAVLTKQLLVFGRRESPSNVVIATADVLDDLTSLLRPLLGETINLEVTATNEKACVEIDSTQFSQVLVNLAINARDAMPSGGRIAIAMDIAAPGGDFHARHPEAAKEPYVSFSVEDQGTGMDDATSARIFEPFFTTKEQGKGTGLGLAMVYGFVQQSKGIIEVDTALGEGTTFTIYLPLADREPEIVFAEDHDLPLGEGRTILLSEDDEALRNLVRLSLEELGYNVLVAVDGFDALEVEEAHDGHIDLLLSDVVMPNMGGFELSRAIQETRPDTKILFMSGYPARGDIKQTDLPEGVQLLQKPLDPEYLARAVHDALHDPTISTQQEVSVGESGGPQ